MAQAPAGRARGRSCQQTVMILLYGDVSLVRVARMKDRLLIATLAGVGFLAALGIAAVREDRWEPTPALVAGRTAHLLWGSAVGPPQASVVRPLMPTPAAD